MNIYMWSGPRNLSTALMRSFENRNDTFVWDEPLYAYYLSKTNKNHPLKDEIVSHYETKLDKLIPLISKNNSKKKIFYQKHMTHHILKETSLDWITKGFNCFLIRNPKDVLISYIEKNNLENIDDIGFPMQKQIYDMVIKKGMKALIINADDLSSDPKKTLKKLCDELKINFTNNMLKWPPGIRNSDGIWGKIWYKNVQSSTKFHILKKKNINIPSKYTNIYEESLKIYDELNSKKLVHGR